jgi:hypothetical protein
LELNGVDLTQRMKAAAVDFLGDENVIDNIWLNFSMLFR